MGRRKPSIIVSSDTLVGRVPEFSKYINLSSAPHMTVAQVISRIPSAKKNATALSLNGRATYINSMKTFSVHGKNDKIIFILDDDDSNKDIKVRNICARNRYKCIGKVIFKKEKPKYQSNDNYTLMERIANHHHKRSVLTKLVAGTFDPSHVKNVNYVTIVKTDDDHAGSIAGLTVALNMRGVNYHVANGHVEYPEGWITSKKRINCMQIVPRKSLCDINPENDKNWNFKTGYDAYFNSDMGPCAVTMVSQVQGPNISKIEMIIDKIKHLFEKMKNWITGLFKNKRDFNGTKHKLAWTNIIKTGANVVNTTCLTYSLSRPTNASKEIKKANSLISSMQINKMLSKVGPTGDKTFLNKKQNDAFNAYITATTSYNVTDAITHANVLTAKKNRVQRLLGMYLSTAATLTYYTITYNYIMFITILAISVILTATQVIKPEALILLNMLLTSGTLGGLMINTVIAGIEMLLDPPSSTNMIRSITYLVVWIIIKL